MSRRLLITLVAGTAVTVSAAAVLASTGVVDIGGKRKAAEQGPSQTPTAPSGESGPSALTEAVKTPRKSATQNCAGGSGFPALECAIDTKVREAADLINRAGCVPTTGTDTTDTESAKRHADQFKAQRRRGSERSAPRPRRDSRPPRNNPGFRFAPDSDITAEEMAEILRQRLPERLRDSVHASGDRLWINRPRRGPTPDWHRSLQTASRAGEWRVTTGEAGVVYNRSGDPVSSSLAPDVDSSHRPRDPEGGGMRATVTLDPRDVVGRTYRSEDMAGGRGARVPGHDGLIVVADHVTEHNGTIPGVGGERTDAEIANTFVHEAAAHAGRISRGRPAEHGHREVEDLSAAIDRDVPDRGVSGSVPEKPCG
jgi:hypothetical protein